MNWVFLKDNFVAAENAQLHYRDLSIQRGYGIFDFCRLIHHTPLFLDDHLNRFFFSAEQMRLNVRQSKEELKEIIFKLIEKNNLPDSGIKLTLTGGYSEDGYLLAEPNLIISQHTFKSPTKEQLQNGIKLMLFPHQRQLPHVKTIDYLMPIYIQPLIKQNNADDALYFQNEMVTECPRNNFFIVTKDEKLVTPATNMLKGITRNKLVHKASQYFELEERNVSINDVRDAKETFITSTTKGILPVANVDDKIFEERTVTKKLQELLEQVIHNSIHETSRAG